MVFMSAGEAHVMLGVNETSHVMHGICQSALVHVQNPLVERSVAQ